ncbi:MAG: malonyl CoA-acyl carrier protein transacylase [Proteobacteria bacterium SG_bin7]|nr:MAG: malonyl CoA-acyl carrier protein transacylase [Proteobacteria bacterium SG_bin7]
MWAAVFPGQGSQHVGMGRFLFENFKSTQLLFEEASDSISTDFKKLCFEGPEEILTLTENTQPALLLVSTATHKAFSETCGDSLKAVAGHSIGEYAAAVAAGSLKFSDGIKAVKLRGQAMQSAVPVGTGAMLAVLGLEDEQVKKICKWAEVESKDAPLEPANFNSPGQVVISGKKTVTDWLKNNFKAEILNPPAKRTKFIELKVSAPFHCSLMKPAEEQMKKVLTGVPFEKAQLPIVQNFDAKETVDGDAIREKLIRQVSAPVLWTQCINRMKEMGLQNLIELGPGQVLSGLTKKIDSAHFKSFNITSLDDIKNLEKNIKNDR